MYLSNAYIYIYIFDQFVWNQFSHISLLIQIVITILKALTGKDKYLLLLSVNEIKLKNGQNNIDGNNYQQIAKVDNLLLTIDSENVRKIVPIDDEKRELARTPIGSKSYVFKIYLLSQTIKHQAMSSIFRSNI